MKIAYNGGKFFGFQSQRDQHTVLGYLQETFSSVGIQSHIVASGRTDRGVHATGQVISLELPSFFCDLDALQRLLNAKLHPYVWIKQIWQVPLDFHARYWAKRRSYCYVLSNHPHPFWMPFALFYQIQSPHLIQQALAMFVGRHDFQGFMKRGGKGLENPTSVREIYQARLVGFKNGMIIYFCANGFLRSQVRLMVGFLLALDRGKLSLAQLQAQLQGEVIYKIPICPNGLFLTRVHYGFYESQKNFKL